MKKNGISCQKSLPGYSLAFRSANEDVGDFRFLSNHEENSEISIHGLCYLQS